MYHPHIRPISTLPAFGLSLSASLHDRLNPSARDLGEHTLPGTQAQPASMIGGALDALRTHPLHVDHVGEAVVRCIEEGKGGVVDVELMRHWAGFKS